MSSTLVRRLVGRSVLVGLLALVLAVTSFALVQARTAAPGRSAPVNAAGNGFATMNVEARHGLRVKDDVEPASYAWPVETSQVTAARDDDVEPGRSALRLDLRNDDAVASLVIVPPAGEQLTERRYDNVRSLDPRATGTAEMDLLVEGEQCNDELYGSVDVRELAPDLSRVWVVYQLRCESAAGSIFGEVRIGSSGDGASVAGPSVAASDVVWPLEQPGGEGHVVPVVVRSTSATPSPLSASVSGSERFRIVRSTCGEQSRGDVCRVLVGFSPDSAGAEEGRLRLSDATGTTAVALHGRGAPGTTRWRLALPDRDVDVPAPVGDIVVQGDATTIVFDVNDGTYADSVSGLFIAPDGGLRSGRTYAPVRNDAYLVSGGSTTPSMRIDGLGLGSSDEGEFTVHEATYGSDGELRSLSLSFGVYGDDGRVRVAGSLAWRTNEAVAPDQVPPPDRLPQLAGVLVNPQVGSADVTWRVIGKPPAVGGIVSVRPLGSKGPFRTVWRGTGLRARVPDLRPGRDVEIAVQVVDEWRRVTAPVTTSVYGTRLLLDARRNRSGGSVATGRLVDSSGAGVPAQPVTLLVRGRGGRVSTTDAVTNRRGIVRLRSSSRAPRVVTAIFDGTRGLDTPVLLGAAATVTVPSR